MTRLRLLVPAAALVLVPACGGDGGGGEQSAGAPTKEEFVAEANGICQDARSQLDQLAFPTAPAEFAPYVDKLVATAEDASSRLTALELPEDDAARLKSKLLNPLEEQVRLGKEFAEKVQAAGGDQAKLLSLLQERPGTGAIDLDFAREYGLGECAEVVTSTGG